jgi:Arc/MetJ-type ribon-helix-helix transcriptional regulator
MSLPLPADLQSRIEAQLATGEFASDVEVLREAIDALESRQRGLKELRNLVAAAEEDVLAGRIGVFDREAMKRDVRDRLAERGIRD